MTPRRSLPLLASAALALALTSCGSSGETTSSPSSPEPTATTAPAESPPPSAEGEPAERSVKVEIANFEYNPDPVRVQAGGKVIWLNQDSVAHTATADDGSFDTGTIDEGKLKSETFKQPGTFTYHCEIHPQMHGTIEVVEEE
jgi:plastocyanin